MTDLEALKLVLAHSQAPAPARNQAMQLIARVESMEQNPSVARAEALAVLLAQDRIPALYVNPSEILDRVMEDGYDLGGGFDEVLEAIDHGLDEMDVGLREKVREDIYAGVVAWYAEK